MTANRQRCGWAFFVACGFLGVFLSGPPSVFTQAAEAAKPANSPQEALNLYADAANFQNNNAFDLAAEEWEKFLKKFPQDPLAAKAQQYLGV